MLNQIKMSNNQTSLTYNIGGAVTLKFQLYFEQECQVEAVQKRRSVKEVKKTIKITTIIVRRIKNATNSKNCHMKIVQEFSRSAMPIIHYKVAKIQIQREETFKSSS